VEHNIVELLAPASVCAATGLMVLQNRAWGWKALAGGVVAAVAIPCAALQNSHFLDRPRRSSRTELRTAAAWLKSAAPPDAYVLAPLEVAAEAGRLTPVHYPEIEGLVSAVERALRSGDFGAFARHSRSLSFDELHAKSHEEWRPAVRKELAAGQIQCALIDEYQMRTPLAALQTIDVPASELHQLGFAAVWHTSRYTAFQRR